MNSKRKGKEGELALAQFLRSQGFAARRGQQFSGTPDSPDIVSDFPAHIECKVTECLQLRKAVAQAQNDSGGKPWVIFHKWNRGDWIAIMPGKRACELAHAERELVADRETELERSIIESR